MRYDPRRKYKNPKVIATVLYQRAKNRGLLLAPKTCELCQEEATLQGHHPDYAQPYAIVWLCAWCHKRIIDYNIEVTPSKHTLWMAKLLTLTEEMSKEGAENFLLSLAKVLDTP